MNPAVWFVDSGIAVFPLVGKEPACKWKDYVCTREQAARFRNYGVRLETLAVSDTDTFAAEAWATANLPATPFMVQTARGWHRYYRRLAPLPNYIHRDGHAIELRNAGQYVVGPGSIHPGDPKRGIPPGLIYTATEWSWDLQDVPFFPTDFLFDDRPPSARGDRDGFAVPLELVESERHYGLFHIMRSLAARGVPFDGALAACRIENMTRCKPPLADGRALDAYLRRAYFQPDTKDFTRTPQRGWELAGGLVEIGLSADAVLVAVRSITPDFDPNLV